MFLTHTHIHQIRPCVSLGTDNYMSMHRTRYRRMFAKLKAVNPSWKNKKFAEGDDQRGIQFHLQQFYKNLVMHYLIMQLQCMIFKIERAQVGITKFWFFSTFPSSLLDIAPSLMRKLRPWGRDWPVSQLTEPCSVCSFYLSNLSVTVHGSCGTPKTGTPALNYIKACRSVTGPYCMNRLLLMINCRK